MHIFTLVMISIITFYGSLFYSSVFLFIAALRSRCGHYIFALWFRLSFFLRFFLSLPNLSRRTLDVYHTSIRGVALVQI